MFARFTTSAHFGTLERISSVTTAPPSPRGSKPSERMRPATSGFLSTSTTVCAILSTIGFGVPAGANSACQFST